MRLLLADNVVRAVFLGADTARLARQAAYAAAVRRAARDNRCSTRPGGAGEYTLLARLRRRAAVSPQTPSSSSLSFFPMPGPRCLMCW